MSKLIVFLLMSPLMFGQTDSDMGIDSYMTEKTLVQDNIGLLGYQFKHGIFYDTRISDTWKLQSGLFNFNSDNYIIVELPLLVKHNFNKDFRSFFGTQLDLVIDSGFSTLQQVSNGGKSLGASAEFGLQYDVSDKVMIEFRYSLPIIEQSAIYPLKQNMNNNSMFFLGSGFKF